MKKSVVVITRTGFHSGLCLAAESVVAVPRLITLFYNAVQMIPLELLARENETNCIVWKRDVMRCVSLFEVLLIQWRLASIQFLLNQSL